MKRIYLSALLVLTLCISIFACKKNSKDKGNSAEISDTAGGEVPNTGFKTLDYLYTISGKKTVAGIHNREPNSSPARWTNEVYNTTGKYPGYWSGDFLFQEDNISNRQIMIDEALNEWKKGALINIMWHACNPAKSEPCGFDSNGVLSGMSDKEWNDLLTDGTEINKRWKYMMDEVCVYLQQLKDKNVEVLWRPLHEMNQGKFWWGGRPGENGTRKLYQLMHDYMVKTKGLTNLIWVWDVQDFSTLAGDVTQYNPGKDYWDVAALDVYDVSGYTMDKYNTMVKVADGKPVAIGECQKLPTASQLVVQPKWTFFMGWSELEFQNNTNEELIKLHAASNVVTLDEMPGWE